MTPSPPLPGSGEASVADEGGIHAAASRSRDESLHARNVRLRREFLELSARADSCSDVAERAALLDRADRVAGEFVAANAGLAGSQSRRFRTAESSSEDYHAVAVQGLWEAFTRWDPDRGVAFSTFSRQFISGRLMRSVRRTEFGHLTQQEWASRAQVLRARSQLERDLEREPSLAELAEHCSLPLPLVERMFAPGDLSLDRKVADDLDLHSSVADDSLPEVVDQLVEDEDLEPFLAELTDRQLFAALFVSPSLAIEPTKLTTLAQRAGVPRNSITPDAFAASVRMARSLLASRLGHDPSPEQVAAEMGLEETVQRVAMVLRRSDSLPQLRESLVRCRSLLDDLRRSGAPSERVAAASAQVDRLTDRLCGRLAAVVSELSDLLVLPDPSAAGGFRRAEPEDVLASVWEDFRSGWPEGVQESAVMAGMRRRLVPPHRRGDDEVPDEERLQLSSGWVRSRLFGSASA